MVTGALSYDHDKCVADMRSVARAGKRKGIAYPQNMHRDPAIATVTNEKRKTSKWKTSRRWKTLSNP